MSSQLMSLAAFAKVASTSFEVTKVTQAVIHINEEANSHDCVALVIVWLVATCINPDIVILLQFILFRIHDIIFTVM